MENTVRGFWLAFIVAAAPGLMLLCMAVLLGPREWFTLRFWKNYFWPPEPSKEELALLTRPAFGPRMFLELYKVEKP